MNYLRIYQEFILNRRKTESAITGYRERHHILPVALGGTDEPSNLIELTAGDHYFAHLCLAQIYGGGMWAALWATSGMTANRNRSVAFKSRRMVAVARSKMAADMAERRAGVPQPKIRGANNGMNRPGVRDRHAEAMKSQETSRALSEAQLRLNADPAFVEKRASAIARSWADPDVRTKRAKTYASDDFKSSQRTKAEAAWGSKAYRETHRSSMRTPEAQAKMRDPKHAAVKSEAGKMRAAAADYFGFKYHALPPGKTAEYKMIMQKGIK